mgnify:CR=1 FL=1
MINIIIGISGVLPSYFVTGFNLAYFGFGWGLLVSFIGESLGAIVAFLLYRKGLKKPLLPKIEKYPKLVILLNSEGKEASLLIIYLRMLPFMPSGLVTLGSALGKIKLLNFAIASSLGKIPAMLIEALTVYQVIEFNLAGKLVLLAAGSWGAYGIIKHKVFKNKG